MRGSWTKRAWMVISTLGIATLSLLPMAAANHVGPSATCTITRPLVVLGGLPQNFIFGDPAVFCHIHAACVPNPPATCEFKLEVTVTGDGVVDAMVEDDESEETASCGPALDTCTATLFVSHEHEVHTNCFLGITTTATDVAFTCTNVLVA